MSAPVGPGTAPIRPRQRPQRPLSALDPRQPTAKRQGLSRVQIDAAIAAQNGLCAVGGEPLGSSYAVDHDHRLALRHGHAAERGCSACFRGIVCHAHNGALGMFGDDPAILRRAADYLERRR